MITAAQPPEACAQTRRTTRTANGAAAGGRGAVPSRPRSLPVVGPEVILLERNGLAGHLAEGVISRALVGGRRVHRRLGLLRRLNPLAAVPLHAGTSRDQLADDDVLLQADQRVRPGVDRRVGQDS